MLNKVEYLLSCLAEECAEVQQAVSKTLRFGPNNHHPKSNETNRDEIIKECIDVLAIIELLKEEGFIEVLDCNVDADKKAKKVKVLKYWKIYHKKRIGQI